MTIVINVLLLIVGFVLLVKGADWFVEGASGIADKFGIPQLVIGLTIVAMGTSAPEAAVSITAALKGTADITIGNVVGSNIMNVFVILGVSSAITAIAVAKTTIRYEIPIMLGATLILLGCGMTGGTINRWEGILMWVCFIGYLAYMFVMTKKGQMQAEEMESSNAPMWKMILMAIIGLALIIFGSDVTVDAATALATAFGMSERFIGLTIVALGTSLPELFVVSTSALIIPVVFASGFIVDCLVATAAGVILWLCVFRKKKLTRAGGILMLACYAAYFAYLLIK